MKAAEILLAAASHIEAHGLAKFDQGAPDGPCCIVGAVNLFAHGLPTTGFGFEEDLEWWEYPAEAEAKMAMIALGGTVFPGHWDGTTYAIARWNDDLERTAEDAVEMLRKASEVWP